jgi:hypothetical protein
MSVAQPSLAEEAAADVRTKQGAAQARQQVQRLKLRAAHLEGVKQAEEAQAKRLREDVAQAKARAGLNEEVQRIFQALQDRAHERSVGAFERLLTAILEDVLPGSGQVRLLPQLKGGAAALDLALQKGERLEDILEGNGGALTNVICAGLRFAALSRTANRKFLVMDEPDCWLKPERVGAFFRVVSQVSLSSRIQTVFISHHSPDKFEGLCNLVELREGAQGEVEVGVLQPLVSDWPDDTTPGVRAIELFDVRRHRHSRIPCYPGATALIGDNNLGKSTAIVSALRAVGYGESDDTLIRHGQSECRIVAHLEGGRRVEMSRKIGRTPAVLYRLYQGEDLVNEGRPPGRGQVPAWVTSALGIARVDDLDIQLGSQKAPVFLLGDTASRRAQILSVGRESGHLRTLLKRYDELRVQDRETIRQGEAALTRLAWRERALAKVEPAAQAVQEISQRAESLLDQLEQTARLGGLVERMTQLSRACERARAEERALRALPEVPALQETAKLEALAKRMAQLGASCAQAQAQAKALGQLGEAPALHECASLGALVTRLALLKRRAALVLAPAPAAPTLHDNKLLHELGRRLSTLLRHAKALESLPRELPAVAALADIEPLRRMGATLAERHERLKAAGTQAAQAQRELEQESAAMDQLLASLGGLCPLCGSSVSSLAAVHCSSTEAAHAH